MQEKICILFYTFIIHSQESTFFSYKVKKQFVLFVCWSYDFDSVIWQ